ncbi:Hexokinase [Penicillium longicatenatum]|uniref:Hexokinase n=1 Tax=Penicillium longicatenatum TaxID=1561947 RepID=UPI00254710E4|nr:Hexokinase [Penicillium longicatenatum]KAJ5657167.1 Hexokinase [Penicillium longicatenatum]
MHTLCLYVAPNCNMRQFPRLADYEGSNMSGFRYRPEILKGMSDYETEYLKQYENWFILEPKDLKRITDHFVTKLNKGLSKEGGTIPMNPCWIMGFPSGHETGRVLTLDMGGTNLRICRVCLSSRKRDFEQFQRKIQLPEELKTGTGEQLWNFVAECLELFLKEHHIESDDDDDDDDDDDGIVPLSFTYSFSVEQKSIRSGILQRWTKNLDVFGMKGQDVIPQLKAAFKRHSLPARIVALLNDTTGTLIASHYRDPKVKLGSIFSTGCNAAYMEERKLIQKLEGAALPEKATVIINTEYGAFDNDRKVLPFTPFDSQSMEHQDGIWIFDGSLSLSPDLNDLKVCRYLIGLVATRAARLYACGIAAICKKKKNIKRCHVGVDGSVFNKYSGFKGRAAQGLRDIFDWPPDEQELIALNPSEDGSSVGAALAAALIIEGEQKAKPLY